MSGKGYDPSCADLALAFIEDYARHRYPTNLAARAAYINFHEPKLAQDIQDAIERYDFDDGPAPEIGTRSVK